MSKSVNTLNFGDKVYLPSVTKIEERSVVEISKTQEGIKVGLGKYSGYDINHSAFNAAISNTIKFKSSYETIFYLNIDQAKAKQKQLQIKRLIELQRGVETSLKELNEFTLKYFTEV